MSTAAVTAVAFAVAAVLSFFAPRRFRVLLVVAVCLVPIVLAAPKYVRLERSDAAASARASVYSSPPPFKWTKSNRRLIAGIVDHVPAHASVTLANAPFTAGWMRWLAYSIAPRQLVDGPAKWTLVFDETPAQAKLYPAHAWRYRNDWLVEK